MQLHLAAVYVIMGLNQLGGEVWWSGTAVWWLAARTETRLVDLTGWNSTGQFMLLNLWTHLAVVVELMFGLLIWVRVLRPILMVLVAVLWLGWLLLTGELGWCLLMVSANVVFLPGLPGWIERLVRVLSLAHAGPCATRCSTTSWQVRSPRKWFTSSR